MTEEQRALWIQTVLAVIASDASQSAFISGYNGQACPAPATQQKLMWHRRGIAVRAELIAKS